MRIAALSFILLFQAITSTGEAITPKTGIVKISSRQEDKLVFKVDRTYKGGEVEVLSVSGQSILKQMLTKRKMIIDRLFKTRHLHYQSEKGNAGRANSISAKINPSRRALIGSRAVCES